MKSLKEKIDENATPRAWCKFVLWGVVLILFSLWVGNLWLVLLLPIVFDIYVSKYVHWNLKDRKDGKKAHFLLEWIDAILFALVAVALINNYLFQNYKIPTSSLEESLLVGDHLFVSKLAFGPRNPMTPLAFPLAQHTMPITNTKSYFDKPQWDYKRLKGFGHVANDDIVVFNFPAGDSALTIRTKPDYYALQRKYGRDVVLNNPDKFGELIYRPIDRRDNYVKRCVAIPGDDMSIVDGQIYINGKAQEDIPTVQHGYVVTTTGRLNPLTLTELGVTNEDLTIIMERANTYHIMMTDGAAAKMRKFSAVTDVTKDIRVKDRYDDTVFPHSPHYTWNRDNFGPLHMPAEGETVELNMLTLPLYKRIITAYEGNDLKVKGGSIFINGELATSYTFKQNYYFMMGDNRHGSSDSRFWGFVPEDHMVGRPVFVWLSLDPDKKFPKSIRWERFFKFVPKK